MLHWWFTKWLKANKPVDTKRIQSELKVVAVQLQTLQQRAHWSSRRQQRAWQWSSLLWKTVCWKQRDDKKEENPSFFDEIWLKMWCHWRYRRNDRWRGAEIQPRMKNSWTCAPYSHTGPASFQRVMIPINKKIIGLYQSSHKEGFIGAQWGGGALLSWLSHKSHPLTEWLSSFSASLFPPFLFDHIQHYCMQIA